MKLRVDRMRRYRIRTLPRPDSKITLSLRELDDQDRWTQAWQRNLEGGLDYPRGLEWQDSVLRYCKAKGLGHPTLTVLEDPADFSYTISWEEPRG